MKMRLRGWARESGSVCGTSIRVGDCLEVGTLSEDTIPHDRLTRAGIRYHLLSHSENREGRVAVSVPDLRRSNRLRWRRYANFGGTRLWIGRPSGHGGGLLIDRPQGRKDSEANAHVRHQYTRAAEFARLVALGRLHPCSDGTYTC